MQSHGFANLRVVTNPLIADRLAGLRTKDCPAHRFSLLVGQVSQFLAYEAAAAFPPPAEEVEIETPLARTRGRVVVDQEIVIIAVLRAGLAMSSALEAVYPDSSVGFIGLQRVHGADPGLIEIIEYVVKLPPLGGRHCIIVDPMIATGLTAVRAIEIAALNGASLDRMSLISILCAPESVREINRKYAAIPIFTASLDDRLDDRKYIVPGLGDAGDRVFNT